MRYFNHCMESDKSNSSFLHGLQKEDVCPQQSNIFEQYFVFQGSFSPPYSCIYLHALIQRG